MDPLKIACQRDPKPVLTGVAGRWQAEISVADLVDGPTRA
jgi:hypothetical protein